jgi:hypothetical protein
MGRGFSGTKTVIVQPVFIFSYQIDMKKGGEVFL